MLKYFIGVVIRHWHKRLGSMSGDWCVVSVWGELLS